MLGHRVPFLYHLWFLAAFPRWWLSAHGHVNHTHDVKAEILKEKWTGIKDVIRDIDHIKEDMASLMELREIDKITQHEAVFYIIRMHDFDDNGGLDGIEMRVAAMHSLEHYKKPEDDINVQERLEQIIDDMLLHDLNNDGLVDYGEMKTQMDREQRG